MVGGFVLLVLFSLAGRFLFAAAADRFRPVLGGAAPIAGFVLGIVAWLLPLALLALLPRAGCWPMLTAARDMVRPQPRASAGRRRAAARGTSAR